VADFKALNPSMKRPVILAAGTPEILLPWDNAKVFRRNFEAYTEGQYASWTAWSTPVTMTASEAARRIGMKESDLRTVNTIPPRMLIKAGSVLIVPRSAKIQNDVAGHVADNGQLKLAPERVTRRTTIKARKHDTVASIAKRLRLSADQVADWNDVGPSARFKTGQQVVVYLPVKTGAKARSRARASAKPSRARAAKSSAAGKRRIQGSRR
jgi:membrane-bound lytic murein transglycosylase D